MQNLFSQAFGINSPWFIKDVDLQEKAVVHISDGKDHQTVSDFVQILEQQNGDKAQVASISCDMSRPLLKALGKTYPMPKLRLKP